MFFLFIVLFSYQKGFIGGKAGALTTLENSSGVWEIKDSTIQITLKDKDKNPVTTLGEAEREKLSIAVVNEDFSFFKVEKVQYSGNGVFKVNVPLKGKEAYSFFLFIDQGEKAYTVSNYQTTNWKNGRITKDYLLNKKVDGIENILGFNLLQPNTKATFTFQWKDEKTAKEMLNIGRVYLIDEKGKTFMVAHPYEIGGKKLETQMDFLLGNEGMYKVWGVFQLEGKQRIFPYGIEVTKNN